MGSSAGRITAGVLSGGASELYRPLAKAAGAPLADVLLPTGALAAGLGNMIDKPGSGAPSPGLAPKAPSLTDAAKQAQLDEQKRQSMTGPSDITNTGGARGILTDPNAKYVSGKLLGGA